MRRILVAARLLPLLRTLRLRIRLATSARERARAAALAAFERDHGLALRAELLPAAIRGRALVVSVGQQGIEVELALIKALEIAGLETTSLDSVDPWPSRYHRLVPRSHVAGWHDFGVLTPPAAARREACSILGRVRSLDDLLAITLHGARVGRCTAATALRGLRVGSLDLAQALLREQIEPFLARSIAAADVAARVVERVRPQHALFVDRGYTPQGELFDTCLEAGIDTVTWNMAHRSNALMMKRYTRANRDVHPASLSPASWNLLRSIDWTTTHEERVVTELRSTYASGDWFSEVGTQFNAALMEAEALRAQLELDPRKPTAVIFPHILWDGTFFWGTDLFSSYEEWLVETLRVVARDRSANWILKIHPAHAVKNARDRVTSQPAEVLAIRKHLGEMPPNVRLIEPTSRISTYSLYSIADSCFTVRGTVGIEAATFGIPAVTAGTGRYDRHGFTIDPDTKVEYLDTVAGVAALPRLTAEQRELALRYAYGEFVLRPLPLRALSYEFERDSAATAVTRRFPTESSAWRNSDELRAFAAWVSGGTEEDLLGSLAVGADASAP